MEDCGALALRQRPVSYTHLDVYKRQAIWKWMVLSIDQKLDATNRFEKGENVSKVFK